MKEQLLARFPLRADAEVSAGGGPAGRLDSWKEIAVYLNRGTRTVQRWEREEQLPVHRLHHAKLGSVYAYRSELDAWWAARGARLKDEAPAERELKRSVAVLPFTDLSREQDQGYFCEGVAEEMIGALSKIKGLHIASRTSAFRLKGADLSVREIGRQLRVGALLEGSVRKSGERLRIAVQLTDADTGYHLWSETYDRETKDVFAIQEETAHRVAETLELALSPKEKAALEKPPTRDVQAYDYYLRGRKFYYQYGPRDMECAIQLFMRAIECDPAYPLAYAGLADCWSYMYLYSQRSEEIRKQADWASQRAAELDPECAQAQASRALSLSLSRRDAEAEKAFEAAVQLDSNLFEAYYFHARHCFVRGESARAVALYEQAMRVRPEDYQSRLLMAQIYDDLGRPDDARAARLRGIELAEEHLKLNPDDARAVYMAANGMAALGQPERGRQWADRALAMRPDDAMLLYNVGCIYSLLGCVEEAITALEDAVQKGLTQKGWYEHDSNLDPLRKYPRFQKLIRGLK
jgi:non-specific serine/threonine protein kinase